MAKRRKRSIPMRRGECRWTKWKRNKRTGETCRVSYCKGANGKVKFKKQECK